MPIKVKESLLEYVNTIIKPKKYPSIALVLNGGYAVL
jgi:hypothetical protein